MVLREVPGEESLHYSDHEAVEAIFCLSRNQLAVPELAYSTVGVALSSSDVCEETKSSVYSGGDGLISPSSVNPYLEQLLLSANSQLNRAVERCLFGRRIQLAGLTLLSFILLLLACTAGVMLQSLAAPSFDDDVGCLASGVTPSGLFYFYSGLIVIASGFIGALIFCLTWGSFIGRCAEHKALMNAYQSLQIRLASLYRRHQCSTAINSSGSRI
ncbi:unnamed protein product [Protopolystoma xenopodis]|uniref:Uncharacterized protein n=1 Tax=Protopolystoma xenopodis TaxID=117903 RepID=A0A448XGZ2_9PLAT|nr:unnamed protein product [Protopolystoma xenopodis]